MDGIISFYNNLFTIEITVFGIIAAAIFVFLQIIYSQFSYREITVIFKNVYLIFYLFLSTLTLILTGIGSLLLSFSSHDFVSDVNFRANELFLNEYFALGLLLSFFVSLVLFVLLTFVNLKFIRPSMIALLIGKNIKMKQISDFLLKKYGIPAPDSWVFISELYKDTPLEDPLIKLPIRIGEKKARMTKAKKKEVEARKKEAEEKMADYQEKYKQIKKEIESSKNPFEPLDALFLKIIETSDLKAIDEACSTLTDISDRFIKAHSDTKKTNIWYPYVGIIENHLKNLMETLRMYIDMCDRRDFEIAKIKILEMSKNIAINLLVRNNQIEIKTLLVFWKEIADKAIGDSSQVFGKIIRFYRDMADYAFDKGIEESKEWLDEIFRHLGWLGERLLSKKGIEEKPIIQDAYYSTEYDQLFNALFSYSHDYNYKYPELYPLIYFDAVYVIFLQLIPRYKENQISEIKNNIFDCVYTYSSFAKEAILKSNSEGAALATLNLKQCYEKLVSEGLEVSAKDTVGLLVEVGGWAAGNKDKLTKVSFLGKPLDEYAMEIIEGSPFRGAINKEIREVYIKGGGDRDAIWDFIKKLGKKLGTNFGFMFD